MVGVALFCHEDPIHAQGDISKDGVGKIVDAVHMSRFVGIGDEQPCMQACVPSGWIGQAHLDFEAEGIDVVIIIGARNGERNGLNPRQGRLKLHLPRGFVPIIHTGHVKQLERHAAVCPWGSTSSPFYTLSQSIPIMHGMGRGEGAMRKIDLDTFFQSAEDIASFHPLFPRFSLVGPQHLSEIPRTNHQPPFHPLPEPASLSSLVLVGHEDLHGMTTPTHASGRAKNRAPFHLAASSHLFEDHGVYQTRGRMHQRIARRRRLAKDGAPDLVRRDEPSTGALPSNAILRFEKATHAYHFHSPKMSRTRCVALL